MDIVSMPEESKEWPQCDSPVCWQPAMWISPLELDDFRCDDHVGLVPRAEEYQHMKTNLKYGEREYKGASLDLMPQDEAHNHAHDPNPLNEEFCKVCGQAADHRWHQVPRE